MKQLVIDPNPYLPHPPQPDREPRRTPRHRFAADQQADRLTPFNHPLQPKPGGERQPPERVDGRFAGVEHDEPEMSRAEHERERPNGLLHRALVAIATEAGVKDYVAANPQQPGEINAGCFRGRDIEHVERVDEGHKFSACGGRGGKAQQHAGPPRRPRSDDLGELPAREPASQRLIQPGDATWTDGVFIPRIERREHRRERAVETARPEQRFKVGAGKLIERGHTFAFYSPDREL
jgi:hypothetical protein